MSTPKLIHLSVTITKNGKPIAFEKWVNENERKAIEKVLRS